MRLENILALTHGTVVNKPYVNNFNNITLKSKDVKRGDLFMAFDESEIEEAVLNGAYGVVFSKPTQISDSEIAWIKVKDIDDALNRLLRFTLINKDIVVYECNEIVLKLALQIITESNFIVLNKDIKASSHLLWNINEPTVILFCPTYINKNIFTKTIELSDTSFHHVNIVEQTLFETSFIYDDTYYERQQLSPFFIPYLEILLHLFKTLSMSFRLKRFTAIDHFEAVFTNKKFEIKEFGTSDKVLIFEKNTMLMEQEILFLQREATWAKIVYVVPHGSKNLVDKINNVKSLIVYKNENEILNQLKNFHFHFALIIGVDKSLLLKPLANKAQISLFDLHTI